MQLEKGLSLAAILLGVVVLSVGSILATLGTLTYYTPSSTPASEVLLNLTGQNLGDGGHRTFFFPVIVRPSARITITVQSAGSVDISVYDANGPLLPAATGQTTYAAILTPSYDTVASIMVANNSPSPTTFTVNATETYTTLTPQTSQIAPDAGYVGLAAGAGLLLIGVALLLHKGGATKVIGAASQA